MKLLLLLLFCLFCSCGTSKRSTETERHEVTEISLSDSIYRKDSSIRVERLLSNKNLQAHIIVTEFSRPDSSGKQYPVKTTEIELNNQESEQSDKQSLFGSEGIQVKKEDLSNQAEEKIKEDVKKDNRPLPVWMWWYLIVGGVITALLTWYAERKK